MRSLIRLLLCSALAGSAIAARASEPLPDTTGPYKVIMEEEASLPDHTVYRPANLAALGEEKLPVVVFGNGACGNAGNAFDRYLAEIASHGYLVIANGPIDATAFGRPPKPGQGFGPFPKGAMPASQSTVAQLTDAIGWARAQAGYGPYQGHIDGNDVAVAGQSCGGLQALSAAADPRVTTAVIMNSGVLRKPPVLPDLPAGVKLPPLPDLPKPDLGKLHTPILYIIGGPTDIAFDNANGDLAEITTVPVYRLDRDTGHNGTFWEPHGGAFAEAATAWLDWRLKGKADARAKFVGPDCGYCTDASWKLQRKLNGKEGG
jgi:dienelactone hydrolase